jgi:hypothetical protein
MNRRSSFIIECIGRIENNTWEFLTDEGEWSMFEFSCRVCFGVDVGDFFELDRTFASNRILVVSAQKEAMIIG